MSLIKGISLNSLQQKRYLAIEGYVFAAIGISSRDVGTIENMVRIVNDVFEARITHTGNVSRTIDEVWGYVSGLSRKQRKALRRRNIAKVPYAMKGAYKGRRDAVLSKQRAKIAKDNTASIAARADALYGPTKAAKEEFYKSWEWRTLRMEVIKQHGRICQCCGARPGDFDMSGNPVRIVVDHIKPISKHWNLRLQQSNLQILCDECNQGKGNWDETDFRQPEAPDEWLIDDQADPQILHQLTDLTTGRLQ